jgi:hypothetical protein
MKIYLDDQRPVPAVSGTPKAYNKIAQGRRIRRTLGNRPRPGLLR